MIFRWRTAWLRCCILILLSLGAAACAANPTPAVTATMAPSRTPRPTATPTRTPTPTPTATLTPTATPTPVLAGTPISFDPQGIVEINLQRVVELARWGLGSSRDLAWSPDGSLVAVATRSGVVLFHADDLTEMGVLAAWEANQVAIAPDGKTLAVTTGQLELWSLETMQRLTALDSPASAQALDLHFSPDGGQVGLVGIVPGKGGQYEAWDVASSTLSASAPIGGPGSPLSNAVLSPDFNLAALHGRGTVQIVRTRDGAALFALPTGSAIPGAMAFSPDSASLAVAYPDGRKDYLNNNSIEVFSTSDGSPSVNLFMAGGAEGQNEMLLSVAYSPDGRNIAAGFANQVVRIWSSQGGGARQTFKGKGLPVQVAFSADSVRLAAAGLDVWNLPAASGVSSAQSFGRYNDVVISPDGSTVALAGYRTVELRSSLDGSLIRVIGDLPGQVRSLSFYPGGQTIAVAASDSLVRLYRVSDGRFISILGEGGPPLWSVAFSPSGEWLAWGGENQLVFLYDLPRDFLLRKIQEVYVPLRILFAPDSGRFASLTSNGLNIRGTDGVLVRTIGGIGLEDAAFSLDGSQIAVVGDGTGRIIEVNTGIETVLFDYREDETPTAVAYSPDSAFLAIGWSSGKVELYWANTKERLRVLEGHRGAVRRIAFLTGSRAMLTIGEDGTLRVWGPQP